MVRVQPCRDWRTDFWPYGVEHTLPGLSTFLRDSYERGLAKHLLAPLELFVSESLESFKI